MRRLALLLSIASIAAALWGGAVGAPRQTDLTADSRFTCYPAQFRGFRPRQIRLVDRFGARLIASLEFPETVCPPAPGSATKYLICFRTKVISTTVRSTVVRGRDEFGRINARVVSRGLAVCVGAARVDKLPNLRPSGVDPFTCYPMEAPTPLRRSGVSVRDEFGTADDTVKTRVQMCAPAGPIDGSHLLSCSTVDSDVKGKTVILRERDVYTKAALGVRARLCTTVTPTR